jgi:hypothetical protein
MTTMTTSIVPSTRVTMSAPELPIVARRRPLSRTVVAAFGTIPSINVLDDGDDDVDCRGTVVAPPVDARDDVCPRIASILPGGTGATSAT